MNGRAVVLGAVVATLGVAAPAVAVPAVGLSISGDRSLVLFDTGGTAAFTGVKTTGIENPFLLEALDVRPATGELYGVATSGTMARLYKLDWGTGAASAVGTPFAFATTGVGGVGMDFDPVNDAARVVAVSGSNMLVNMATGAATSSTAVNPAAVTIPDIAHSQNVAGATQTTLYAINSTTNTLGNIGGLNGVPNPNLGTFTPVGLLGATTGDAGGFDIAPDGKAYLARGGFLGTVNLAMLLGEP